jgi:hypothetical protein
MPTPIEIVAGGLAAVSVTVVPPVCVTLKLCESLLPTPTVPLNVSVVVCTVGVVVVVLGLLLHALTPPSATATSEIIVVALRIRRMTLGVPHGDGVGHRLDEIPDVENRHAEVADGSGRT